MPVRRVIRWTSYTLLCLLALVVIFVLISVGPVDRTPIAELPAYDSMEKNLRQLEISRTAATSGFSVGYAVVNLTPPFPVATAGYGNRKGKTSTGVRDSLYVRTLVIDNGTRRVAIVSADLLLIPPLVTAGLEQGLEGTGFDLSNTFLGATHTHNGVGNWGSGATRFIYGAYDQKIVDFIIDRIRRSIDLAAQRTSPATIRAGKIAIPEAVNNRMISGGFEDPYMRLVEFHRCDSSKLLLMSYTAHATCLFSKDLELSRDYPGALVDTLEASGYDFAMFMAGAVASHGFGAPMAGDGCIDWMAAKISARMLEERANLRPMDDTTLAMVRIPLPLSDPQVKISEGFKIRSWLFEAAFGSYPVFVTGLRVGNVVFLGVPGDFSGAFNPVLDSIGTTHAVLPIVTGFNGGYIGYLTPESFYDHEHYETRFMNWYAPGTGEYIRDALGAIMRALADRPSANGG